MVELSAGRDDLIAGVENSKKGENFYSPQDAVYCKELFTSTYLPFIVKWHVFKNWCTNSKFMLKKWLEIECNFNNLHLKAAIHC